MQRETPYPLSWPETMARTMSDKQRAAILWLSEQEDCFVRGAPWQHAGSLSAMTRWSPAPVAKHRDTSGWQPVAVWNLTDEGRDIAAALNEARRAALKAREAG